MIYYDTDGTAATIPFSAEVARRTRNRLYMGLVCSECGGRERYTKNNKCVACAKTNARDFYNYIAGVMRFEECEGKIIAIYTEEFRRKYIPDREVPLEFYQEVKQHEHLVKLAEPLHLRAVSIQIAMRIGLSQFVIPHPCEIHGHLGIVSSEDGICYFCTEFRKQPTPRQRARAENQVWYIPTTSCPRCHTLAKRRVSNGECSECFPPGGRPEFDNRRSETTIMMEAAPDMVISREGARSLDLKVFRTGTACRRGHKGFRWVSTGGCIDCLKGRP